MMTQTRLLKERPPMFRETRMMNGREATVELEVAEYNKNQSIRMISDAGGTVWDTVFTVAKVGDATEMKMVMEAKPHKFMARIMNPLIRGMVAKAVEADMDCVKDYCESQSCLKPSEAAILQKSNYP